MKVFRLSRLAGVLLCALGQLAWAQQEVAGQPQEAAHLPVVEVVGEQEAKPANMEVLGRKQLDRQMVQSARDLVRYSTDVGVSEDGRRSQGFAIRGVDNNRVNMRIDGVALPDSQENTLYARYGNFNNSRLTVDPALVREVAIHKNADSLDAGSGALGGSVHYKTLESGDIVQAGRQWGAFYKTGYTSRNREWHHAIGLAYKNSVADFLLAASHRRGHETQIAKSGREPERKSGESDAQVWNRANLGDERMYPDPSRNRARGYMAKINWTPTPQHLLGIAVHDQRSRSYTHEDSYSLLRSALREADDHQKRQHIHLYHEYFPQNSWLASIKTGLDWQDTVNGAINYKGERDRDAKGYYRIKKSIDKRDERNFEDQHMGIAISAQTHPLKAGGEHTLQFGLNYSRSVFENVNHDREYKGGVLQPADRYAIQVPVRTDKLSAHVNNTWVISPVLTARMGLGHARHQVRPQSLRADIPCPICDKTGQIYRPRTFSSWAGHLALDAQVHDNWKLGYAISSGYRVPSASEMYFQFENGAGDWSPNPRLKAERSLGHTLSLQGSGRAGQMTLSAYQNRYKDFLFERESWMDFPNPYCTPAAQSAGYCKMIDKKPRQQMVNADRAKTSGVEFSGVLNLDQFTRLPAGWKLFGAAGYSRGSIMGEGGGSLMSIQPARMILGLDYEDPGQKWGVFSRVSYTAGKKAKDARFTQAVRHCVRWEYDAWLNSYICKEYAYGTEVKEFPWLSRSATVVDVFGYYRPTKNMTLRAGVYNLFNRKYHTWDSLRGINANSTSNSVGRSANSQGLNRFLAPGRNLAVSFEYAF